MSSRIRTRSQPEPLTYGLFFRFGNFFVESVRIGKWTSFYIWNSEPKIQNFVKLFMATKILSRKPQKFWTDFDKFFFLIWNFTCETRFEVSKKGPVSGELRSKKWSKLGAIEVFSEDFDSKERFEKTDTRQFYREF